jgi:hypothetical protein
VKFHWPETAAAEDPIRPNRRSGGGSSHADLESADRSHSCLSQNVMGLLAYDFYNSKKYILITTQTRRNIGTNYVRWDKRENTMKAASVNKNGM